MSSFIAKLQSRLAKEESGFTLIELLIVLVIIGILLAIAVPSYLGFKDRANKSAAAANVRSAVPAVEAYYADYGSYATTGARPGTGHVPDQPEDDRRRHQDRGRLGHGHDVLHQGYVRQLHVLQGRACGRHHDHGLHLGQPEPSLDPRGRGAIRAPSFVSERLLPAS